MRMIREKILLESALRIPSKYLGLGLLHIEEGIPILELASAYSVDEDKLESAVSAVRAARENDRVRRFLDMVRRNGEN